MRCILTLYPTDEQKKDLIALLRAYSHLNNALVTAQRRLDMSCSRLIDVNIIVPDLHRYANSRRDMLKHYIPLIREDIVGRLRAYKEGRLKCFPTTRLNRGINVPVSARYLGNYLEILHVDDIRCDKSNLIDKNTWLSDCWVSRNKDGNFIAIINII